MPFTVSRPQPLPKAVDEFAIPDAAFLVLVSLPCAAGMSVGEHKAGGLPVIRRRAVISWNAVGSEAGKQGVKQRPQACSAFAASFG